MKVSLQWLADFLPELPGASQIAEALTHGGFPVESIEEAGGDTVLDVEVTSNRGDCLSHLGVAREIAALTGRPLRPLPQNHESAASSSAPAAPSVRIDDLDLCPHYTARVIRNVTIAPSPQWMARRLQAVGLRPINNVVDVTNYVMFEMGQPLHAFDLDRLKEGRIVVRRAAAGEQLVSIDGHLRALQPWMLVIADASRPVALAGVMGGKDSEVSEATVNVLLESARFDPLSIRRTARALAMASDSSYRFERGIDPTLPQRASLRAAQLIAELGGGTLEPHMGAAGADGYSPRKLTLRLARLKAVLGIEVLAEQALDALQRLELAPVLRDGAIEVTVPSWRMDLNIEADLIEEVARVIGYDKVPVRQEISIRLAAPDPSAKADGTIRETLVGAGYFEAVTFSWASDALAGDFLPREASGLPRADATVRKADASLRPSILPGLLEAVRHNETVGTLGARLFEIGSTFWLDQQNKLQEHRQLGLVGSEDVHEVRGVVEAVLAKLNDGRKVTVVPQDAPGFAAGACGAIQWDGQTIGRIGKIDPGVCQKLSLRAQPCAAELRVAPLLANAQQVKQLRALPRFPAIRRDLSLIVPESVQYAQLERMIRQARPAMLEDVEYVTTYRGKPLEKGAKSLTVTLIFRSAESTLASEQVEPAVQQIIAAATRELSATLRS